MALGGKNPSNPPSRCKKRTGRELGGLRSWDMHVSARASSCLPLCSCPVPIPRGGPYLWCLASVPRWNDGGKLRRQGIRNKTPLLAIRNPKPGPVAGPTSCSDHTAAPFKPVFCLYLSWSLMPLALGRPPPFQRPPQQRRC